MQTKSTPNKPTKKITQARADAIILKSKYADHIDESEITTRGYVYGLDNGRAVVVRFDGRIIPPR